MSALDVAKGCLVRFFHRVAKAGSPAQQSTGKTGLQLLVHGQPLCRRANGPTKTSLRVDAITLQQRVDFGSYPKLAGESGENGAEQLRFLIEIVIGARLAIPRAVILLRPTGSGAKHGEAGYKQALKLQNLCQQVNGIGAMAEQARSALLRKPIYRAEPGTGRAYGHRPRYETA